MKFPARLILPLALVVFAGCMPTDTATTQRRVGKPAGEGPGFHNLWLDEALERARAENKLVLLDFSTEWCVYCKKLDADTWPDSGVQTWLKQHAIAVKVDGDQEPELVQRYGIRGFPTLVFLNPDGSLAGKVVGFRPPEPFLKEAADILAKSKLAGRS